MSALTEHKTVLQPWFFSLGLWQQSLLLSAIRGCDNIQLEPGKQMLRLLRGSFLLGAAGSASDRYLTSEEDYVRGPMDPSKYFFHVVNDFLKTLDSYPTHYMVHFQDAAKVVAYYHTDAKKRDRWLQFLEALCWKLHSRLETQQEMENRLG
jgi:hypothetical protein